MNLSELNEFSHLEDAQVSQGLRFLKYNAGIFFLKRGDNTENLSPNAKLVFVTDVVQYRNFYKDTYEASRDKDADNNLTCWSLDKKTADSRVPTERHTYPGKSCSSCEFSRTANDKLKGNDPHCKVRGRAIAYLDDEGSTEFVVMDMPTTAFMNLPNTLYPTKDGAYSLFALVKYLGELASKGKDSKSRLEKKIPLADNATHILWSKASIKTMWLTLVPNREQMSYGFNLCTVKRDGIIAPDLLSKDALGSIASSPPSEFVNTYLTEPVYIEKKVESFQYLPYIEADVQTKAQDNIETKEPIKLENTQSVYGSSDTEYDFEPF